MQNLLWTSLENIKKFVNIICEFYEQYDDENNKFSCFFHSHKKSWNNFLNIIKNENLNCVSKDDDKWIIEIQNKFNDKIKDSLVINWKDKKIDSLLEKIYKEIILESELLLKDLEKERPNFKNELKNIPFCRKNLVTLYNFYVNKILSGQEIENLLTIKDQEKNIFGFQDPYYEVNSICFYLDWFTKDLSKFYSNYQILCKKLFVENIDINYLERAIYDYWSKKESNNNKRRHNFVTIISAYKKLAKLAMNSCLDESILFSTLRKVFDSIYQIKHDVSWTALNEKRKKDEINIIGDLFSPITDKLKQIPDLKQYVFNWFLEVTNPDYFSIFKNQKYANKFYNFLNFYSHNEPYDDSFFLKINTLKIKVAFGYECKSWYGYCPYYFQNIIDNKILFFLEKEKIEEIIVFLKQKINENFEKSFCEKFIGFFNIINMHINNIDKLSTSNITSLKEYNSYFEFLNLGEINKINSKEDIKLLISNEEINYFEKLKKEINNFKNPTDYKELFKFLKNKIRNSKFKLLKNEILNKSELIEEIKKLTLFKDHNKMINEPQKINFLKLYHYVNDNDFEKIKEKIFTETFKNECLTFFSTINFINNLYQKFIPLILFSNDLISKENCFSILNAFEWNDSQKIK